MHVNRRCEAELMAGEGREEHGLTVRELRGYVG